MIVVYKRLEKLITRNDICELCNSNVGTHFLSESLVKEGYNNVWYVCGQCLGEYVNKPEFTELFEIPDYIPHIQSKKYIKKKLKILTF